MESKENEEKNVSGASKKPKITLKEACNELIETTAMHGLPNIKHAKNNIHRLLWLLIFLGAVGFCIYQLITMFTKYYSYPTSTYILLIRSPAIDFPAITFCNVNPVTSEAINTMPEFASFKGGALVNYSSVGPPKKTEGGSGWDGVQLGEERSDMKLQGIFQGVFLSLSDQKRKEASYKLPDMMLDCRWKSQSCGPGNFTETLNPNFGTCFTFNANNTETVSRSGPDLGLSITLFIDQTNYVKELVSSAGVKVVVHNQSAVPFPESEGFLVSPGSHVQAGIMQLLQFRTSTPYGTCRNYTVNEEVSLNAYSNIGLPLVGYSEMACRLTCEQRHLITDCGCFETSGPKPGAPALRDAVGSNDIRPCGDSDYTCTNPVSEKVQANLLCTEADCPVRCNELSYETQVTQMAWPNLNKQDDIMAMAISLGTVDFTADMAKQQGSDTSKSTYIQNNFLKFEVFFESTQFTLISTSGTYEWGDLLSDIGGTCGLWLGFSIITMCELVTFGAEIMVLCFGKVKSPNKMTRTHAWPNASRPKEQKF